MPTVNGRIYPELTPSAGDFGKLRIFFYEELPVSWLLFFAKISVLHNYLSDKGRNDLSIEFIGIRGRIDVGLARLHSVDEIEIELLDGWEERLSGSENIDIIIDAESKLDAQQRADASEYVLIIDTETQLLGYIEDFLAGHSLPWSFELPVWNQTWVGIYFSKSGLSLDSLQFMSSLQAQGANSQLIEKARYLANKNSQIEYCKSMLSALMIRKRKSSRLNDKFEDYTFEISYHLSNYYFLMAGGCDILARILNELLALNIENFTNQALEKNAILTGLQAVRPDIFNHLSDDRLKEWITWLKYRRNFIAHEASMGYSEMVQDREVPLTEAEIEAEIDSRSDWGLLRSMLPPELYESQRAMVRNIVIVESYEVIMTDITVVRHGNQTRVFRPLQSIQHDLELYDEVVSGVFDMLSVS